MKKDANKPGKETQTEPVIQETGHINWVEAESKKYDNTMQ